MYCTHGAGEDFESAIRLDCHHVTVVVVGGGVCVQRGTSSQ
jgi:hypothetical protein